eukprot:209116_1
MIISVIAVFYCISMVMSNDCSYVNLIKSAVATDQLLIPPNTCQQSRTQGIYSSIVYQCIDQDSVALYEFKNTDICVGNPWAISWYNRSDGYDMNCDVNGKDCSSLWRIYTIGIDRATCNLTNADYQDASAVIGMCYLIESKGTMSTCKTNQYSGSVTWYNNKGCDGSYYYENQTDGCHPQRDLQTTTYSETLSCNNA